MSAAEAMMEDDGDEEITVHPPHTTITNHPLKEPIIEALREVYDPEIPVNIYEIGLIYDVAIGETGTVHVNMTLTSPMCPVAGEMPGMVEEAIAPLAGVSGVAVDIVWDPPWSPDMMAETAKIELNMW